MSGEIFEVNLTPEQAEELRKRLGLNWTSPWPMDTFPCPELPPRRPDPAIERHLNQAEDI